MSTMTRFKGASLTPLEWPHLSWIPFLPQGIRIEDYLDENRYVVRAELPGIDPVEDLRITCIQGQLQLDVVRRDRRTDAGRSEFRYGSFFRVLPLPAGVKEETLTARYADGILEITAELGALEVRVREIPIQVETSHKPVAEPKPAEETVTGRKPAGEATAAHKPAKKE